MKGLQKIITVDVVDWLLDMSKGWQFSPEVAIDKLDTKLPMT